MYEDRSTENSPLSKIRTKYNIDTYQFKVDFDHLFQSFKAPFSFIFPFQFKYLKKLPNEIYQNKSILYKITISVRHNRVPDNFQIFAKEFLVLIFESGEFSVLLSSYILFF
jgi:hypothetical protein